MTDGVPPERRCPICGDLNVHSHPDSLCPKHHPAEDPDVTPSSPTLAEARAVAGDEPTGEPDRGDVARELELELVDEFERTASREFRNASYEQHKTETESEEYDD